MTNSYAGSQDAGEALLQSNGLANIKDKVDVNEGGNKASRGRKGSSSGDSYTRNKEMDEFEHRQRQWYRLVIFDLVLWMFSVVCDCFFREIRPRGAFRLPRLGPVIFVAAPHANQFVDPIILMGQVRKEAQRRVSFLIAAKSYKQRIIGFLSRCQFSIPVVRAQDNLKKGSGKIFINVELDPCRVTGKNTKFLLECTVRGMLALPQSLGASEILEIISDTEIIIRKEFKRTEQITTLLKNGTSFKRADRIDQKKVYQIVFRHLSLGNCIGIFPEGGSHDRTDLLPLKAGVAIMALGAMEYNPDCNVKIVPCGMNYFNAHKFRSRAVVEFGHPIEIPKELVKKYLNPETNRESVKELLDLITTGLKAVTVTCEDYETLMVVQAARRLYAGNFVQFLPLPLVVEMNRRLVLGYQTFKNDEQIKSLKEKIIIYNNKLKQLYLPDHHVEACDESHKLRVLPILLFRIVKLFLLMLLALPGATLFSPVFICTKWYSKRKAKVALANSTVKIKANDVVATWKILISMGIAPLVYSFYASIGTWYCNKYKTFEDWNVSSVFIWFTLYMLGVTVTYSALLTGEQGMDIFKSIRPLYLSITSGSSIKDLKKLRNELSEEITYVVNHFGPELFPNDFNLLKLKDHLKISDNVEYVDSDEEEERKTQEVRKRRMKNRKAARRKHTQDENTDSISGLSLDEKHSSSVSDGISLMNSDNSLTNIPMFSDYHLHMNAKNPDIKLEQQSVIHLSASIADDFNYKVHNSPAGKPSVSRKDSNSQIELNFGNLKGQQSKSRLSDKIKYKIRESRDKASDN
ncbi:uncharacterized protein AC631_02507 [Debaryomyces fabryi]|uniref:Phospholipid/glycerol acyltransferase domain-containing protein n=1 Tax=Debaryomyces fabryi TaxID=58627 RepID=A0A0V1Q022_9ASCO|nr:uncharacterized protein AC631_02507 [Debaryomyces fabryi]KSA01762.1 hypothetical protein AC631_02507 [Debaryomyces fabryi]CUM51214.1 unnamed protein product [Debaryomyces fabryi]